MSTPTFVYVVCEPTPGDAPDSYPLVSVYSSLEKAQAAVLRSVLSKHNPSLTWVKSTACDVTIDYWETNIVCYNGDREKITIVQYPLDRHPEDMFDPTFVAYMQNKLLNPTMN